MRARTAPAAAEFPAWWDAQIETLLNGDEDRRSREVRETRQRKRAITRRIVIGVVIATALAAGLGTAASNPDAVEAVRNLVTVLTDGFRSRLGSTPA